MVSKPDLTGRIARWMLLLQEFDFTIKVRPGKKHANANFFSRIEGEGETVEVDDSFPDEQLFLLAQDDSWYKDIVHYLNTGEVAHDLTTEAAAVFLRKCRPYAILSDMLHKEGVDGRLRRCLERHDTKKVMMALHEEEGGGHFAAETTTRKILDAGYWWPSIHKDVANFMHDYDPCQ